ncbi:MAG TPA: transglutaminase family protein, partial [Burkholderiales bacterium]|nr:transglutaminase family protein [Burkholderiales bacterium]
MDRRAFLKSSAAVSATAAFPGGLSLAWAGTESGKWRQFEVTTRVEVLKPSAVTRVWLPTPLTGETAYQKALGNTWSADGGSASFATDPKYGAGIVSAQWPEGQKPVMTLVSRFATRDIAVELAGPGHAAPEDPALLKKYLAATELIPTDGIVRDTAAKIVKDAPTDVGKARSIYEWIVDNTHRDPKTRGCGLGDIRFMLETNNLGGKCADLNALFVGLCRASGVPARDVYGIRVAKSELGYKSLGAGTENITKAQHCRAEFYAAGHGWVPADPADVRKVILEEAGGKQPDDPMVLAARKRLFGSWEMNWLAYNFAHDLLLPGATRGPVAFFMYPQCETAEGRL